MDHWAGSGGQHRQPSSQLPTLTQQARSASAVLESALHAWAGARADSEAHLCKALSHGAGLQAWISSFVQAQAAQCESFQRASLALDPGDLGTRSLQLLLSRQSTSSSAATLPLQLPHAPPPASPNPDPPHDKRATNPQLRLRYLHECIIAGPPSQQANHQAT
ncbi:hypothetical protein Purlil1_7739 [Purpureocillium lilacinum]|uniref:Uncharacterized protein n=1 Tax=Purpureocillium lilacinum TaxID=33203 RepID=A0ABR0BVS7_PURLI|nr:hypothetical protein Purlil1_7739 [Purpureocillium lilacinum]